MKMRTRRSGQTAARRPHFYLAAQIREHGRDAALPRFIRPRFFLPRTRCAVPLCQSQEKTLMNTYHRTL